MGSPKGMSLDYVFLAQVAGHRFADISNVDDPDGVNPGLRNLRLGGVSEGLAASGFVGGVGPIN